MSPPPPKKNTPKSAAGSRHDQLHELKKLKFLFEGKVFKESFQLQSTFIHSTDAFSQVKNNADPRTFAELVAKDWRFRLECEASRCIAQRQLEHLLARLS